MTTTFETAKAGDKVWSIEYGWGVIEGVPSPYANEIMVRFEDDDYETYNLDGSRFRTYGRQTLFWDEVKVDAPKKPMPELEVDTKVWVWWTEPEHRSRAHFSHFEGNILYAFDDGRTSFSKRSEDDVTAWLGWELAE